MPRPESELPFHTWKLVTDGDDFTLTDDELMELTIVEDTYEEYSVLPENGETYTFACTGRSVRLSIHEEVKA